MEVWIWLWWGLKAMVGIAWGVIWFLVGGWAVTLAQLGVLVLVVFGYKYGWRQAPAEVLTRARAVLRYGWAWARRREAPVAAPNARAAADPRRRERMIGDVNLSTLLSLAALLGLGALFAT